ncbi:MAG: hypothetical protein AAB611_03035, partial [Patescibacteria group bacterium]
MLDDQKPFHISLDTPAVPPGDSQPLTPPPVIQNTAPPTNIPPQAAPIQQTSAPTPAPSPQPTTPTTPPVMQPIRPPVMPAQGGAPRTPHTVALPMAPHIVIHTMESDIQDAKKEPLQPSAQSSPPSMSGGSTSNQPPNVNIREVEPPAKSKLLIGTILILAILGATGYFGYDTIAPLFSNKTTLPIAYLIKMLYTS